jgi:hypothetical protein
MFKDIVVPSAEEHLVKPKLVQNRRDYRPAHEAEEAAYLFSIRQRDILNMLRGEFRQFSENAFFLVQLDYDVEIVVKPHRNRHNRPALHVS